MAKTVTIEIDASSGRLWIDDGALFVGEMAPLEFTGHEPAEGRSVSLTVFAEDRKTPLADNSENEATLDLRGRALRERFGKSHAPRQFWAIANELDGEGNFLPEVLAAGWLTLQWSPEVFDVGEGTVATLVGPPGAPGSPGLDGSPGKDLTWETMTAAQRNALVALVAQVLASNPVYAAALKGSPGLDGSPGAPGLNGIDGVTGYVECDEDGKYYCLKCKNVGGEKVVALEQVGVDEVDVKRGGFVKSVNGTVADARGNVTILLNFLPLSGGTMTGNITFNKEVASIANNASAGRINICGGTSLANGGALSLCSKDNENSGWFILRAGDGTDSVYFVGKPNGALTWDGKIVERVVESSFVGGTYFYVQYASGLIIQGGRHTRASEDDGVVIFPKAFTSTKFFLSLTRTNADKNSILRIAQKSTTGFIGEEYGGTYTDFEWIAIGK